MGTGEQFPLASSTVYLSPQYVEADVAKFTLVSVMSVTHHCSEKVILDSVVYCYSDSSPWPRAQPEIYLAPISGAFQRAGTEHRRGFSL